MLAAAELVERLLSDESDQRSAINEANVYVAGRLSIHTHAFWHKLRRMSTNAQRIIYKGYLRWVANSKDKSLDFKPLPGHRGCWYIDIKYRYRAVCRETTVIAPDDRGNVVGKAAQQARLAGTQPPLPGEDDEYTPKVVPAWEWWWVGTHEQFNVKF